MNILGQPFLSWVTKQIEVRQQSLGYKNYGNKDLITQNAKTPWIRLASTVDIQSDENGMLQKLKSFGISENLIIGPNAAKNFILQGGATGITDKGNFKTYSGLNDGSFYSGAYGWGGTTEKGFTPLPGIIDASLVYYNNGALSKAVVNMKCYNRNQLALMDALYMRPGYNLLLEFGWSTYLDNDGILQKYDSFQSPALQFMLRDNPTAKSGNPANFEIPRLIGSYRETTSGNYEGVFGKITNFKWEFNPDGSYNCQTTITGMGGVIEALKVSGTTPLPISQVNLGTGTYTRSAGGKVDVQKLKEDYDEGKYDDQDGVAVIDEIINANNQYTELDKIIDKIYIEQSRQFKREEKKANDGSVNLQFFTGVIEDFPDPDDNFTKKSLPFEKSILLHDEIETDTNSIKNPTMYLSLGYLFGLIQKDFLIYDEKGNPMFTFDINFENVATPQFSKVNPRKADQNFFQHLPGQFSSNPLVCVTPFTAPTDDAVSGAQDSKSFLNLMLFEALNPINTYFKIDSNPYVGRLAFIYVNFEYIKRLLKESKRNKDGTLPLLTFLQTMFDGISTALGGINKIEVFEDTSTNKIKFIENIPQNWGELPPFSKTNKFCKLNTFGVTNNIEGSIVKNLDLNASISKEFASMISIGAQNNGNQINENATAFSNYNKGLIDRTFKTKSTDSDFTTTPTTPGEQLEENNKKLQEIYNNQLTSKVEYTSPVTGITNPKGSVFELYWNMRWSSENLTSLENVNKTWTNLLQGVYNQAGKVQANFFLPFELSLDIEGISGIQLFQKFEVDDKVLPPSYAPNSVDIQIKAANHTVNATEWTTKLETQSVPKSGTIDSTIVEAVNKARKKRKSFKQSNIAEVEEPTLETITSKYPITQIFFDTETPKKQLYLHHTVSGQDIQSVVDDWSRRTDKVSTHYVTNNNGEIEQLFEDEFWAYHLGVKRPTFAALRLPFQNLNRTSIGIELCSWGGLTAKFDDDGSNDAPYADLIYRNNVGEKIDSNNVTQAVNANGETITYKGYKYFEKYSDAQINVVKGKLQELMSKYSIPFKYDYDELFGTGTVSIAALSGKKGVYTHNSVRTDKSDVFPQKELIEMLKSISTS